MSYTKMFNFMKTNTKPTIQLDSFTNTEFYKPKAFNFFKECFSFKKDTRKTQNNRIERKPWNSESSSFPVRFLFGFTS